MVIHPLKLDERASAQEFTETFDVVSMQQKATQKRPSILSALITRFFFLFLFVIDIGWLIYSTVTLCSFSLIHLLLARRSKFVQRLIARQFLALKRSSSCALALFAGLFCPAFGIMIACTYFLMYDKAGVEEVIPTSLQEEFKEFVK